MGIKQTLDVLNAMEADGIIGRYAIAGAVAAYNYVEPAPTEDLDIIIAFEERPAKTVSGLVSLEPIYAYLKQKGFATHRKEGILIGDWQVQFLPVASDLDQEALAQAEEVEIDAGAKRPVRTRVLRPEHIVGTCLRVGRPKDLLRISQFLSESAVNIPALCEVLSRHGLQESWRRFCARTGSVDPCNFGGAR